MKVIEIKWALSFLAVFAAVVFVIFSGQQQKSDVTLAASAVSAADALRPIAAGMRESISTNPSAGENNSSNFTKEDKLEFGKWREEKGYSSNLFPNDVEYESYSYETLKAMAEAGNDVRAMLAFARKESNKRSSDGYSAARNMYELAAVHGSTKAIIQLAGLTKRTKIHGGDQPLEQRKAAWMEVMSMYELAKLRGDRQFYATALVQNHEEFDSLIGEADWDLVRDLAKQQYELLEARRLDKGMGKFDNTEPQIVRKVFDSIERSVLVRFK